MLKTKIVSWETAQSSARSNPRGRGSVRIECTVPRAVVQALIQREAESGIYRTRVAAHVLCQWASAESGKKKGAVSASATDGGLLSKVTVVF